MSKIDFIFLFDEHLKASCLFTTLEDRQDQYPDENGGEGHNP